MKKLGLIGGIGPESTIEYYRSIEYGVQKKSGQNFFPNITIESLMYLTYSIYAKSRIMMG